MQQQQSNKDYNPTSNYKKSRISIHQQQFSLRTTHLNNLCKYLQHLTQLYLHFTTCIHTQNKIHIVLNHINSSYHRFIINSFIHNNNHSFVTVYYYVTSKTINFNKFQCSYSLLIHHYSIELDFQHFEPHLIWIYGTKVMAKILK